jgi:predicted ester cyclase
MLATACSRARSAALCGSTQPIDERQTINKSIFTVNCVILLLSGCRTVVDTDAGRTALPEVDRSEANKALARVWFDEVINNRNLNAIAETYAADYVHHGPERSKINGLEAVRAFAAAILAASDDRRVVVEQQVAEGDLVVTRFTSSGRHTGVFRGIEPTGRVWTTEGICISRIENGKIEEDWEIVHQSGI